MLTTTCQHPVAETSYIEEMFTVEAACSTISEIFEPEKNDPGHHVGSRSDIFPRIRQVSSIDS